MPSPRHRLQFWAWMLCALVCTLFGRRRSIGSEDEYARLLREARA